MLSLTQHELAWLIGAFPDRGGSCAGSDNAASFVSNIATSRSLTLPLVPPRASHLAGINGPVAAGDAVRSGNASRTHGHTTDTPPGANESPPRPEKTKPQVSELMGECAARDSNPEPAD